MKKLIFLSLLLLSFLAFNLKLVKAQDYYYTTDVKILRDGRDKEFRDANESPLTKEEFSSFKGLRYYSLNPESKVEARLIKTPNEKPFEAETSRGELRALLKYGYLEFNLKGVQQRLNVYQPVIAPDKPGYEEVKNTLFLPFKDLTNGKETYGGGRYISMKMPETEKLTLNFNLAYNPSCAYNSKYSCFLVPKQNHLKLDIKAGEKVYPHLLTTNLIK